MNGPTREERALVIVLVLLGHTEHCAWRCIVGDGACECRCPRFLRGVLWIP